MGETQLIVVGTNFRNKKGVQQNAETFNISGGSDEDRTRDLPAEHQRDVLSKQKEPASCETGSLI